MRRRQGPDAPNEILEKPVLLELIGPVKDYRVLDLGCGDAAIASELINNGAQSYLGLDGSQNMVAVASQYLMDVPAQIIHADIESWEYPPGTFNLVISRLALHYLRDLDLIFQKAFSTLTGCGRFIFSVEHPVITSSDKAWQHGGARQDWIVDDYFKTGPRITSWMGGQVIKYHRTVEDYFIGLKNAGFSVEHLREAHPQREHFTDEATYQRRSRIPLFLILASRKISQASPPC